MSLKQEIQTWVDACDQYDKNDYSKALQVFDGIADQSKILFNMGVIHATIGEHDRAVECYAAAIRLDQYLAVAYFQQGVSNFLVGDFEEALANFNDTLLYMRGNTYIDYDQLGLKFRLYSCEILFNRGLCYIYLQQEKPGMEDMRYAQKEKMTPDHEVIDEAIRERAMGYTVFSIPVGVIYRPNEAKVKNLGAKDYLGKARLIATANANNMGTGFIGAEQKEKMVVEMTAKDDRPTEQISYAATNLVDRSLSSRAPRDRRDMTPQPLRPSRDASAPPLMQRNQYPPTPPPENDKPFSRNSGENKPLPVRTSSMRNPTSSNRRSPNDLAPRPGALERSQTFNDVSIQPQNNETFGINRQNSWSAEPQSQSRRAGPLRTASESRYQSSRQDGSDQSRMDQRNMSQPPRNKYFGELTPEDTSGNDSDYKPREVIRLYEDRAKENDTPRRRKQQQPAQQQQQFLDEEDEYIDDVVEINPDSVNPHYSQTYQSSSRPSSRRPEMKDIRVKVRCGDDTRYIMFGVVIDFGDFESRVREKFRIKNAMKIMVEHEGDTITLGDQEDLNMVLDTVKDVAKAERSKMGKMEIWVR